MDDKRYACVDCRARAPEVETEYTLISSRFGWRLTRKIDRDGTIQLEWRCPTCWARRKQEKAMVATPGEGVPSSEPSSSQRGVDLPPGSRRDPKR
ncbi:MAG: hypothetical protein HYV09_34525 [Deltaproteobacteria bacterium]|nr:hypothetical protein [Deltaproteobacteria bacterium]